MPKIIAVEGSQFRLHVKVQPRSSRTQWGRRVERERIQLKITSPPVDGAANKACIKFISREFKTSKTQVSIEKGEKSRCKTFLVKGYDEEKLRDFLRSYINS